ncbi:drug resistance transporter, EmrB/QacA subfamily [Streptoalloteichus tenebrarius]|uniref:Drug resistance transporter, EmrB/QacA subfamily n=1 Tax=Streptoalloteichus tenebrarius (strain ATCC 17920 / DSM 40477 / JCM 4838 / CBS 697.72 / NBRC 16177 / NCIMB 11028 / NRRL B-12390 / A12253. 1 / ISP 5477) TaxID=1933 RepID=A0ABT1I0N3_STRSD|nr:DHA2 family efflux MFS transporter permease subunit [Streptoalloteichus tenebrarius]MCP2261324.1 drug resistance transporter, EmrB/QacA subfamily [Streptoalloteichus tenebrarius]BFF03724.1 MDR family MFS transporter [Streptoalloteichus tenebrarius]
MAGARADRLDPALLRLIAVVLLGGFMGLLDGTIVNVGMGTLSEHFARSLSAVGWVATGYLLAVTFAIPFTAWAVDRFGSRKMWLLGLGLFVTGSLASGLAWNVESLVVFRVVQGFGGGMLDPIMLTVLARAAGPGRVGRVMGLMGVVIPLGPVLGPVLGGLIIEGLGWRWMFLVNIPVGLLAVLLSLRVVPADPPRRGHPAAPLDVIGLALLGPAFAVLTFALSRAGEEAGFGTAPVLGALALGAVLLAGYVLHAVRAGARALIGLHLFRGRGFSASVTTMGLTGVMLFSMLFLVPLYQQEVRGHGVLAAGLLLAPLGVGSFLAMPVAGRLSDKVGARRLAPLGACVIALSALVHTQATATTSEVLLGACAFATGVGLGLIGAPTMGSLYRTLPGESVAQGTSALYIVNQLGASLGVAVVAMLVQRQAGGAHTAVQSFQTASWWVCAAAVAVLVAGWFLPGRPATAEAARPDARA